MSPPTSLSGIAHLSLSASAALLFGCASVQQDEVGIKRTFGRLHEETLGPGLYFLNPFTTSMQRLPVRTQNVEIAIGLPSREGLTVKSSISILYRIEAERAHEVLRHAGPNYEKDIILSIFRAAASDVCSRYPAKDMHSGRRAQIEVAIQQRMTQLINKRGFEVEAVLLKNIVLPPRLAASIEDRLAAEQDALRMRFILEREQREAERKMVEAKGNVERRLFEAEGEAKRQRIAAEGDRDAQKIRSEGLTPEILRLRAIEAFEKLSASPNAKVIITDGDGPQLTLPTR